MQHAAVVEDVLDVFGSATPEPEREQEPSFDDPEIQELDFLALARELARDFYPPPTIVRRFGLSRKQGAMVLSSPAFKRLYVIEKAAWDSSENAAERARQRHREAQALGASELASIMLDQSKPLKERLEAFKLSATIGGLVGGREGAQQQVASGPGFSVNIILGEKQISIGGSAQTTIEGSVE